MSFTKWFLLCCAVSLFGALASVVIETTNWFGIDAGTSWTFVWWLGFVLALAYGSHASRGRLRLLRIVAASGLLTLAVLLTLGTGFLMKAVGIPVPWRGLASDARLWVLPLWQWFVYTAILAVGFGVTRLFSRSLSRLSGGVSRRHKSSD